MYINALVPVTVLLVVWERHRVIGQDVVELDTVPEIVYEYDTPAAALTCTGPFKYSCDQGRTCINQALRCDGHIDCYDKSDEDGPECEDPVYKEGCNEIARIGDWTKCMAKFMRALGILGAKPRRETVRR